jgi:ABC-type glycerol-3-phosphate transport system substrate-binding protein
MKVRWGTMLRAAAALVAIAVLFFTLSVLFRQSSRSGPTETPTSVPPSIGISGQALTITFGFSDPDMALREPVSDFRMHHHITVEVKKLRYSRETTIADLAEQADCFDWSPPQGTSGDLEAIFSLEPFLEADSSFSLADFYPSLLAQFTRQGQLYGLPGHAVPYVVKYNVDLFDAAGRAYPAPDWTTDDFLQTAIALTRGSSEDRQYGFVAAPIEYQELMLMLERRGARPVDRSVDPPTIRFDDPDTIAALYWYVALSAGYGVKPFFVTDWAQLAEADWEGRVNEANAIIKGGQAAMWTDFESVDLFWVPAGINVGVAPFPAALGGAAGAYNTVTGYFISAHAEAPQACWEWIAYLTTRPELSRWVPARRSILQSDAYRDKVGDDRATAYQVSLDGVDKLPIQQIDKEDEWLYAAILFWLPQAYGQAVTGEASVEDALETTQRTFDDYRACVTLHQAMLDRQGLAACLQEVDPSLPAGLFGS